MRLLDKLRRLRLPSLERGDHSDEGERPMSNTDALAAAVAGRGFDPSGMSHASFPPNYVKQDDGRPQH